MSNQPFNNDADQQTRRRVERDTYLARAQADSDLSAQGRFKRETATSVVGVPAYPQQPENSWASGDPTGDEPPLGFDINQMEPTGTPAEVEASLRESKTETESS